MSVNRVHNSTLYPSHQEMGRGYGLSTFQSPAQDQNITLTQSPHSLHPGQQNLLPNRLHSNKKQQILAFQSHNQDPVPTTSLDSMTVTTSQDMSSNEMISHDPMNSAKVLSSHSGGPYVQYDNSMLTSSQMPYMPPHSYSFNSNQLAAAAAAVNINCDNTASRYIKREVIGEMDSSVVPMSKNFHYCSTVLPPQGRQHHQMLQPPIGNMNVQYNRIGNMQNGSHQVNNMNMVMNQLNQPINMNGLPTSNNINDIRMNRQYQHTPPRMSRSIGELSSSFPMSNMPTPSTGVRTPCSTGRKRKLSVLGSDEDIEQELKRMAYENADMPLVDLAARIRDDYGEGHSIEKYRQIFGVVWLVRSCKANTDAVVPRNRIYARYVSVCADNSVKPLSPASFGKLVRILFPNIRTRRLGTRGQSKYHYCGVCLIGEPSSPESQRRVSGTPHQIPNLSRDISQMSPDTPTNLSGFPSNRSIFGSELKSHHRRHSSMIDSPISARSHVSTPSVSHTPTDIRPSLSSPNASQSMSPMTLCPLEPFLPQRVDIDAADTLFALYRSYCGGMIEAWRYMQIKNMYHLVSSFYGSLTSPVQKLYACESVAPWIQQSDFLMYREMLKMISSLTLQEIPIQTLTAIRNVSSTLIPYMVESFSLLPESFVQSKLKPAQVFVNSLNRMVRVNETSQAAGRILTNKSDRNVMLSDWKKYVDAKSIVNREIHCKDVSVTVLRILSEDIPRLLSDYNVDKSVEETKHTSDYTGSGEVSDNRNDKHTDENDNENENVNAVEHATEIKTEDETKKDGLEYHDEIGKWADYLSSLPEKFPNVPGRMFSLCMSTILTTALREMTLSGGAGFGAWWILRCWIDEYMGWNNEKFFLLLNNNINTATRNNSTSTNNSSVNTPSISTGRGSFGSQLQNYDSNNTNGSNATTPTDGNFNVHSIKNENIDYLDNNSIAIGGDHVNLTTPNNGREMNASDELQPPPSYQDIYGGFPMEAGNRPHYGSNGNGTLSKQVYHNNRETAPNLASDNCVLVHDG